MTSLLIALAALLMALCIPLGILWKREPRLRSREQAYRFHELRDRLQVLNIQGKIRSESVGYTFLMFSLNLAIRNAGTMRLSDVLQISRAVRRKAEDITFAQIADDVRRQGEEAQTLSAEFFGSLAAMLISNDQLVRLVFTIAKPLAGSLNHAIIKLAASVGKALVPEHAEAVYEAREYQRWGKALAPSY